MLRLFFALWPDDPVRQQIAALQSKVAFQASGQRVKTQNLHLTLQFIGNVEAAKAGCLVEAAARLSCAPFKLQLDALGSFSTQKIIWLGASRWPHALYSLHESLAAVVDGCGCNVESRQYRPHVSLHRGGALSAGHDVDLSVIDWHVDSFTLFSSSLQQSGAVYREIAAFQLSS